MYQLNNLVKSRQQQERLQLDLPRVQLPWLSWSSYSRSALQRQREHKQLQRVENVRKKLDEDIIGSDTGFWGPFGWKKYTYVDHTASGKAVKCIEHFIENQVLPHYANTHTTVSNTSLQTTIFRNEAREIIKQSVGASDNDEIIFCGSGATSAVHKLLHSIAHPKSRKLIVFIGPFEHHSNILPWREAASKVIQVPLDLSTGQIDVTYLRKNLKKWTDKSSAERRNQLVIGCFSAASNITGTMADDVEITKLLHEFGALSFWDYAAAAPHVEIKMNPNYTNRSCGFYGYDGAIDSQASSAFKDAIFFSGHKFLGGPQTPGVLVVKRHVLQNPVPHGMGGGTVLFTTKRGHHYLEEPHEREEGGTPDIVGSIRLGLVFQLRNLIGVQNIVEMESTLCREILKKWSQIPEIHILGYDKESPRLPCISFMVQHLESGYFLHHNFVVALLNDLFGIQCRGGCMCAGPYAQVLLGIDDKLASLYEASLKNDSDSGGIVLKPGFVRISPSYHSSREEINFVIDAVKLIARHGWKLLPFYRIDWKTASFIFNDNLQDISLRSLASIDQLGTSSLNSFYHTSDNKIISKPPSRNVSIPEQLREAKLVFTSFPSIFPPMPQEILNSLKTKKHLKKLRWFMLPSESTLFQQHGCVPTSLKSSKPFELATFESNSASFCGVQDSVAGQVSRVWKKRPDILPLEVTEASEMGTCEFYADRLHEMSPAFSRSEDEYYGQSGVTTLGSRRKNSNESNHAISSGFHDDDTIIKSSSHSTF